jgi:hypothetical protein
MVRHYPERVARDRMLSALRWPFGILVTAWAYMWRTTPLHRRELPGDPAADAPPPLPPRTDGEDLQRPPDGAGPLLHRRYRGRIRGAGMSAEALMADLSANPDAVAPGGLAHFKKVEGDPGRMAVGDEWVVRMPGPWDGPVRVVEVTPRSFRFATLEGHLEAGQIEWRAEEEAGDLLFGVESWARSGDRLSDLMHNRLRMAKEVQLHMWTSVIERVARRAGGHLARGIDIETRLVDVT